MKFTTDEKALQQEKSRLVHKSLDELKTELDADPENPKHWLDYGLAIADEKSRAQGVDVLSKALQKFPLNASLYHARGWKTIALFDFERALSDFAMATTIEGSNWVYWYNYGVTLYFNHEHERSIKIFRRALAVASKEKQYPIVDWLYANAAELGDQKLAEEALDLIDDSLPAPRMDYSYVRRIQLYKGELEPQNLVNEEDIRANMWQIPGRYEHEVNTLSYGLYNYYRLRRQDKEAKAVLEKLVQGEESLTFGYMLAKQKLGLLTGKRLDAIGAR